MTSMRWVRALLASGVALGCCAPVVGHATGLANNLGRHGAPLADTFAESVARSIPVVPPAGGIGLAWNPETGQLEQSHSSSAQLYIDRAWTIGRGHWNASLSYHYLRFDRFEGSDLRHLSDRIPIATCCGQSFTLQHTAFDIETHVVTPSFTIGVSDGVDLGLALPIIRSSFARNDRVGFPSIGASVSVGIGGESAGVGDALLRFKAALPAVPLTAISEGIGLELRLPTGDRDEFRGLGTFAVSPTWIASKEIEVNDSIRIAAHLNLRFDFETEAIERSEGRWGAGVDVGVGTVMKFAVGLLGRHAVDRLAPRGAFDEPRVDGRRLPVFGFDGGRPDYVDLSIGWRLFDFRHGLMLFANVLVPLTDGGLRADPIPAIGVEWAGG